MRRLGPHREEVDAWGGLHRERAFSPTNDPTQSSKMVSVICDGSHIHSYSVHFFYICPFVQPSTKVCFCPCVVVLADKEPHCRVLRSRNHTDAHNLQAGYNWAYSTLLLYSHFHTLGTFTLVMAPCSHHNQSEWPAITKCGCNLVECQWYWAVEMVTHRQTGTTKELWSYCAQHYNPAE